MNRILVIRGGAIGDFILTLPAIKLLRDNFPESEIEILGYKHIVALAKKRFYAQGFRSIEYGALSAFFAKDANLPHDLCAYFSGFDLVVSYLFDPDRIFERNLERAGVKMFLACPSKIAAGEHAAKQLARPLGQLNLKLSDEGAHLYPSSEDRDFAASFLQNLQRPIIALHPGSGSASKNWPIENWIQLSEWLLHERHAGSLLLIGGEADEKQIAAFRAATRQEEIRHAINLPLPHLAAVLENCAVFLGHDSGISHLAAATGTQSVLLFGPTDPETWAPRNPNVRVMKSPNKNLNELTLPVVEQAVSGLLAGASLSPLSS